MKSKKKKLAEKRKAEKLKKSLILFRRELKKSITTAVVAAFSFIIALSWRDVISSWITKISKTTPLKGNLISALIVTVICVAGILIVTRLNHEKTK